MKIQTIQVFTFVLRKCLLGDNFFFIRWTIIMNNIQRKYSTTWMINKWINKKNSKIEMFIFRIKKMFVFWQTIDEMLVLFYQRRRNNVRSARRSVAPSKDCKNWRQHRHCQQTNSKSRSTGWPWLSKVRDKTLQDGQIRGQTLPQRATVDNSECSNRGGVRHAAGDARKTDPRQNC